MSTHPSAPLVTLTHPKCQIPRGRFPAFGLLVPRGKLRTAKLHVNASPRSRVIEEGFKAQDGQRWAVVFTGAGMTAGLEACYLRLVFELDSGELLVPQPRRLCFAGHRGVLTTNVTEIHYPTAQDPVISLSDPRTAGSTSDQNAVLVTDPLNTYLKNGTSAGTISNPDQCAGFWFIDWTNLQAGANFDLRVEHAGHTPATMSGITVGQ
ncbi:MAG: hypothetical protein ACRC33_12485 [Gemmataceae bacterium]